MLSCRPEMRISSLTPRLMSYYRRQKYKARRWQTTFVFLMSSLLGLLIFSISMFAKDHKPLRVYKDASVFQEYRNCLTESFFGIPTKKVYDQFVSSIEFCQNRHLLGLMTEIRVTPFRNRDETKYAIPPSSTIEDDEECNIVTLGIGHDIAAEIKLRNAFPTPCQLWGADPDGSINRQLFEGVGGRYYELAVGAHSGWGPAYVLNETVYGNQRMQYEELTTFLRDRCGIKMVDLFLIDIEGGEFELLSLLRKDGRLDVNNVTVCQFNIEFHWPSPENISKFGLFVLHTLLDGRYIIMKPFYFEFPVEKQVRNVQRLFALNVENDLCVKRYLSSEQNL